MTSMAKTKNPVPTKHKATIYSEVSRLAAAHVSAEEIAGAVASFWPGVTAKEVGGLIGVLVAGGLRINPAPPAPRFHDPSAPRRFSFESD